MDYKKMRKYCEILNRISPEMLIHLEKAGFWSAPSSTKYHGAHRGGLANHSITMTDILVDLTERNDLEWIRPESPVIVGMLHDICKMDNYVNVGGRWMYNQEQVLKGHGDKSVEIAMKHMDLTLEEVLCIRYHMGAFTDAAEWNDYTWAISMYPNVLWTHHADMMAAHIEKI